MRKLLIMLALIVLLGRLPLEMWNEGTPEQQQEFVKGIVQEWMLKNSCEKAMVDVVSNGIFIFFFIECKEARGSAVIPKTASSFL